MAAARVLHNHRIVPGHMGGTYEPLNVIRVSVAMHAALHKDLWEHYGLWQDKIAWLALTGNISQEAARIEACRNISDAARFKLSAIMKAKQADPVYRAKIAAAQAVRWADPQQREAQSARMLGKRYALGNRLTDAQRAKISAALKGNQRSVGHRHPQSLETRAKIGAKNKGNQYALGCTRSPETRAKMSAARRATVLRKQVH